MFAAYMQDALVYRATAVIWIMTDAVPSLILPLLWLSAFNGRTSIQGFSSSQITAYYLVLLGVTNLVQCHQMWEIAGDIREGRFSSYLIRPFSYRAMNYLSFLAWRLMRTTMFVPIFCVATWLFRGTLHVSDLHLSGAFFLSVLLGHFVSFFISYAFGLLALYFVETRSLFQLWYMPLIIFSGQLAPLEMFPPTLKVIAQILPFRYTVALPTEILLGRRTPGEILQGLGMQVTWIVVGWLCGEILWRRGTRRFTGVGL